ncbi:hypothetical protein V9T40_002327 [Parthenolecanium corni]|uniref:Nucleotidyltransferase n=1 Tax=Parthenolecanium corni TaxID=536013 RepID=A0AAN9TKB4_9HEMI
MEELFVSKARELCDKCGFELLFLCENGSRIKGYSCDDSDYDVRGIFIQTDYWTDEILNNKTKELKCTFVTGNGIDVEMVLWNITKALNLLIRRESSQCLIMHWLNSPVIYFETTKSQELTKFLNPRVNYQNDIFGFLGMAREEMRKKIIKSENVRRTYKLIMYSWMNVLKIFQIIEYKCLLNVNILDILEDENLLNKYKIDKDSVLNIVKLRKGEKNFSDEEIEKLVSKNICDLKENLSWLEETKFEKVQCIDFNEECKIFFREFFNI